MKGRGFSFKPEDHPMRKLNVPTVRKIRKLWETGKFLQREIGARFNITQSHVSAIILGSSWKRPTPMQKGIIADEGVMP